MAVIIPDITSITKPSLINQIFMEAKRAVIMAAADFQVANYFFQEEIKDNKDGTDVLDYIYDLNLFKTNMPFNGRFYLDDSIDFYMCFIEDETTVNRVYDAPRRNKPNGDIYDGLPIAKFYIPTKSHMAGDDLDLKRFKLGHMLARYLLRMPIPYILDDRLISHTDNKIAFLSNTEINLVPLKALRDESDPDLAEKVHYEKAESYYEILCNLFTFNLFINDDLFLKAIASRNLTEAEITPKLISEIFHIPLFIVEIYHEMTLDALGANALPQTENFIEKISVSPDKVQRVEDLFSSDEFEPEEILPLDAIPRITDIDKPKE